MFLTVSRRKDMPNVGKKKFAYSAAGKKQAAAYAKKTGKKMTMTKKKKGSGGY
jgi:hypothetical protein